MTELFNHQKDETNVLQDWVNRGLRDSGVSGYKISKYTKVTETTLHKMRLGKQKGAERETLVGLANVFLATLSGSEEENLKYINEIFRHFDYRLFDETDKVEFPDEFFGKSSSRPQRDPFAHRLRKEYEEIKARLERLEGEIFV